MPITYHLDVARRHIIGTATGTVTYADLAAHLEMEQSEHALGFTELLDCRDATTTITTAEIRQLAEALEKLARREPLGATAVVATNDALFGMLRMYDALTEQIRPLRIFRRLADAEQWLASVTPSSPPPPRDAE